LLVGEVLDSLGTVAGRFHREVVALGKPGDQDADSRIVVDHQRPPHTRHAGEVKQRMWTEMNAVRRNCAGQRVQVSVPKELFVELSPPPGVYCLCQVPGIDNR
jgi:hypothetical protein